MKLIRKMTREEMWEEFESQLKCEVRTPITMSYNESIKLAERGIKDVVARWKKRLEQELCDDSISRQAVLNKAFEIKTGENTSAMVVYAEDIRKELSVIPKCEENTVSEKVYTEECMQRKKLEYELYLLKRKISELI